MTSNLAALSGTSSAAGAGTSSATDKAKLESTAKSFEAVFVRQMIGAMRQAGFDDEITGSSAGDQFQDMSDAKTADNIAQHGGFGIADMMIKQLSPKGSADTAAAGDKAKAIATDPAKATATYAAARDSAS